jgi:hypothetical protein
VTKPWQKSPLKNVTIFYHDKHYGLVQRNFFKLKDAFSNLKGLLGKKSVEKKSSKPKNIVIGLIPTTSFGTSLLAKHYWLRIKGTDKCNPDVFDYEMKRQNLFFVRNIKFDVIISFLLFLNFPIVITVVKYIQTAKFDIEGTRKLYHFGYLNFFFFCLSVLLYWVGFYGMF